LFQKQETLRVLLVFVSFVKSLSRDQEVPWVPGLDEKDISTVYELDHCRSGFHQAAFPVNWA